MQLAYSTSFHRTGRTSGSGTGRATGDRGDRPTHSRRGLSLLEILLASAILAVSLAALAQQNATGTRAALRSRLETESAIRCQSQLNRLLFERARISNQEDVPFDDDVRWHWSATSTSSEFPGLSLISVQVFQQGRNRDISTFTLSRLLPRNSSDHASFSQAGGR